MKALLPLGVFPPLAHQGGWDESLLVIGPLAVIGFALWVANKRVASQLAKGTDGPSPEARPGPEGAQTGTATGAQAGSATGAQAGSGDPDGGPDASADAADR